MTRRPTILLTDPINADAQAGLAEAATVVVVPSGLSAEESEAALRRLLPEADGLIVRRQLPDDLFDNANRLRGVVRHGVGLDFIPVERATAQKIPVANTPGVNANAVAEYCFAAMLAISRQLARFDAEVRQENWQSRTTAGTRTFDLSGRTLGIIGYGAIGKRIGEIAVHGFSMAVAAHTTTPSRLPPHVRPLSLSELFVVSDFVIVACPLTPQTRGMVDRSVLAHGKPGAVLINVGRGPIIREDDLADALIAGSLAGAVLDVFEVQPLPMSSRLRTHPNVILTPHLAGVTQDSERAMGFMAVDTVLALVAGERPDNTVNREIWG
ncbi:MAG: D-3-phosphoglycerate dehydrogenase [Pseudomonas sp.]|uniref:hydroxyacid dehydrogenase n=1 Tax=Pseudomonas sp. TaxID=306 RepID=UPI00261E6E4F|nr:hydroxyacid dehydrogenase [Pseudomonas sp.]MDB6049881.1 D-3-phosphoglycerate dehydrogenase [Pseudomonas sp.]